MDLPPLNVNKFQASVDIIRYCEWPKIKKYMNKRIVKAVNECKTQATIINKKSKKFVDQIEKKKWSLKKRSSSKGELEEKYDFDEDEISWGSDFDDEDDLDEDDVANNEFHIDENRFNQQRLNDCRAGHYDLSQLNNNLTNGEQLMNVGRFERISTPTNSLILDNNDLVNYSVHHHSNSITTNNLDVNNLEMNNDAGCTNSMCSSNCGNVSTPVSSSGVSSVCGTESNGSDNSPSVSSYASACSSNSSCNSSAADSTCSQSPIPLSTPNSSINNHTSSSAKLACKLLAKLLSNGQLENEHLSSTNLELKLKLNEQLNKQFSEIRLNMNSQSNDRTNQQNHINQINDHQISNQINEHFKQTLNHSLSSKLNLINQNNDSKSNSMNVINNNYLKNLDFKSNVTNKSMINLSQYNQLNDYQFKLNEHNLNDEIITVKTANQNYQKYKLNNSTSNLSTFKSNSVSNNLNKSIVVKQIEQLNSKLNSQPNSQSSSPIQDSNDNESSGLSSGSSSILSTFKYNSNNSDKSYQTAKESSGSSCSSSIRSISLKQLSINKPTVPPKPNIVLKEDKNRTKKVTNSKLSIRPSAQPPLPPSKKQNTILKEIIDKDEIKNQKTGNNQMPSPTIAKKTDKSPYSSSHSINDLISEFTIAEVEEILANCKLSDDDENDNSFTKKLLQQQFSKTKSLQHLNELEKNDCLPIENGLKLKAENKQIENLNKNEIELNEKLQITKNDLINNLNKLDDKSIENNDIEERKSKFDYKFKNHEFDSKLDAECLNSDAISNLRKTGNLKTKLGNKLIDKELDDYERPICNLKNREIDENYYLNKDAVDQLIENRISPPPEFNDDDKNVIKTHNTFNDELKNQLKKQISLNKHLQSRWSTVDLQSHNLNNNLINTPLPPPMPFNLSSNNNSSKQYSSSMLALQNRPKLPKNKFDFLYSTNRLTTAKKLPGKLKSLPEIFSSKLNGSQKLSLTNKLIDEKLNNTFSSTTLINQINQINQTKYQQNLTNQLAIRPLPPLPLEHYSWFHNLEREDATNLLIKFGVDGGYLVRTSKRAGLCNPYSLSIYHNNKCFNLNIRKRSDGLYALGKEKDKEKTFQSISQLIEYHQTESILLTTKGQNAGSCKLLATPNKL